MSELDDLFKNATQFITDVLTDLPELRKVAVELHNSGDDDIKFLEKFISQLREDFDNGDIGETVDSLCDIATLRNVAEMVKEKYY